MCLELLTVISALLMPSCDSPKKPSLHPRPFWFWRNRRDLDSLTLLEKRRRLACSSALSLVAE